MAYRPNVVTVDNGGTGNASLTAYAVLCGGTTSTGNMQSIAGVGTANQVLLSNGAGALPTFQTIQDFYALEFVSTNANTPADSQTYYVSTININALTTDGTLQRTRMMIPIAGTVSAIYGALQVGGTLSSNENVTHSFLINGGAPVSLSTTFKFNSASVPFSYTGLSTAVSAGDYFQMQFVTPVWATNPTNCKFSYTVLIKL